MSYKKGKQTGGGLHDYQHAILKSIWSKSIQPTIQENVWKQIGEERQ